MRRARDLAELVEADEQARRVAQSEDWRRSMSIFISILGLALLILVHEAGHFFASLAVGLRPRRFYIGFPPPIAKTTRKGIEYGIGAIPLGGFVSIPGMHRPIPHDAERRFSRAVEDAPTLAGPVDRVKRALDGDDLEAGLYALDDLEDALRVAAVSPAALASAEKGLTELRDALGPDAYWKAATWRRLVAIAAGPAANIVLTIAIFTFLFMTVAGAATRVVGTVAPEIQAGVASPAQAIGLEAGDRIIAINGAARESRRDRRHDRRVGRQGAHADRRALGRGAPTRTGGRAARRRALPARLRTRRHGPRLLPRRSGRPSRSPASSRRRS